MTVMNANSISDMGNKFPQVLSFGLFEGCFVMPSQLTSSTAQPGTFLSGIRICQNLYLYEYNNENFTRIYSPMHEFSPYFNMFCLHVGGKYVSSINCQSEKIDF